MIVTIDEFNAYSGNMESDEKSVCLKTMFLNSAEELVNEYLRFDVEKTFKDVPQLIKTTILRISTLMLMEGGENIGVSGKSFSDSSRTFISYTNYMKYLTPIQTYRKVDF